MKRVSKPAKERDLELGDPLQEKPQVQLARSALLLITDYRSFFRAVLDGKYPYRIRPLPFYSICFGVMALTFPLTPWQRTEVGWFEVWASLDSASQSAFMADMDLKDADADKYSTEEAFVPGSSILSDHIKSKVGSVGANDVAFYLVGRDPGIARSFRRIALECEHRSRYHEIVKKFFWPVTVVFFNSLALYLLSRPRRTLRQTLACNLYLQGFWLLPGAAYFALDHFAQRVEPLAVASDVVEVALLATYLAHACRVFKFTHNMGLGRQVLAWLGGTIAQLVLTVLVVGPAVDWVSRYLP